MRQDGAFQEFDEANYGRIVAMSAAVPGNRQEAEDAAQEAFALARGSRLGRYDVPEGSAGWPGGSPSTPAGGCGEPPSPQSRSPLSGTHRSQSQQTRSPSPPSAPRRLPASATPDIRTAMTHQTPAVGACRGPEPHIGARAPGQARTAAAPQTAVLAIASLERTRTSGALGSCGWGIAARVNSAIAPGRKTRQCVEPPYWKYPSSSPFPTW